MNVCRIGAQVIASTRATWSTSAAGRHDGAHLLEALDMTVRIFYARSPRAVHARALSHHAACLSPYARRVRRMAQQSGSRRSIGDAPPTLALDVVIRIAINAPIRVRRRAQLAAHVHCALASHLVARCLSSAARCSSRMFARAYSLCTPRHTLTGSGCHLPHVLAGSARAEARWRARRAARGHAALHVPISNEIVRL